MCAAYSGTYLAPRVQRASSARVYAKRRLSDSEWTYLPYLTPQTFSQSAGPTISQCDLQANYGTILHGKENRTFQFYYPFLVNGAYILITSDNFINNSPEILGLYVIQEENVDQYITQGTPAGEQRFTGLELSHLLDRIYINKSYIDNNVEVDEIFVFNDPADDELSNAIQAGNRSAGTNIDGIHYFSRFQNSKVEWSNLDILKYLFYYFVNDRGYANVQWLIQGELNYLDNIFGQFDFQNKTIWQALDELIPKNNGLLYNIDYNFNLNKPVLKISSTIPSSILNILGLSNTTSTRSYPISLEQYGVTENDLNFSESSKYDRIVVQGGPIYVTFTASFANGLLTQNWSYEKEVEYLKLDEEIYPEISAQEAESIRNEEYFSEVYRSFKIIDNWTGTTIFNLFPGQPFSSIEVYDFGYNFFPRIDEQTGYLDFNYYQKPYLEDKVFENITGIQNSSTGEYFESWTGAYIFDDDELEAEEDRVNYYRLDNLETRQLPSGDTLLSNKKLKFNVNISPNYVMAKNTIYPDGIETDFAATHGEGEGEAEELAETHGEGEGEASESSNNQGQTGWIPIDITLFKYPDKIDIDYRDIWITSTVKSSNKLRMVVDANYVTNDVLRTKYINLPESVDCHIISPNTIQDVISGSILYSTGVEVVKNDINKVRFILEIAKAFYGIPKSIVTATAIDPLNNLLIGDYITQHNGTFGVHPINSSVTQITRSLTENGIETTFNTSFIEIDPVQILEQVSDNNYRKSDFSKEIGIGSNGLYRLVRPKRGLAFSENVQKVDTLPEIPDKHTIVYLTERYLSGEDGGGQHFGAGPEDSTSNGGAGFWNAMQKFTTIQGLPGTPNADNTGY